MVQIDFDDKDDNVKKGPHPDWQVNYDAAKRLIADNEGKLPEGMQMSVDKFRLMIGYASSRVAPVATPITLHQDFVSFMPSMRAEFDFYKRGSAWSNKQADRIAAERAAKTSLNSPRIHFEVSGGVDTWFEDND